MREVGIILPQGKAGNLQGSSLLLQPAAVFLHQGGILPEIEKVVVAQGQKQNQALSKTICKTQGQNHKKIQLDLAPDRVYS